MARESTLSYSSPQLNQALSQFRAGFPITSIGDSNVQVIQGIGEGKTRVKLFFDQATGLLTRQVRYAGTAVGANPIQIDYADYRDVSGVKMPFRWTVTWTNGQSTYEITQLQADIPIDAARFGKPAPAVVTPSKKASEGKQ